MRSKLAIIASITALFLLLALPSQPGRKCEQISVVNELDKLSAINDKILVLTKKHFKIFAGKKLKLKKNQLLLKKISGTADETKQIIEGFPKDINICEPKNNCKTITLSANKDFIDKNIEYLQSKGLIYSKKIKKKLGGKKYKKIASLLAQQLILAKDAIDKLPNETVECAQVPVPKPSAPPSNNEEAEDAEKYLNSILKIVSLNKSFSSLDKNSLNVIKDFLISFQGFARPIIYNGKIHELSDLEILKQGEYYYLDLKNTELSLDNAFVISTPEDSSPDNLLGYIPDELHREVVKIVYNYISNKKILNDAKNLPPELVNQINQYLDSKRNAGAIIAYEYFFEEDYLQIEYKNDELPVNFNPLQAAFTLQRVVSQAQNPDVFSRELLERINLKVSNGYVFVVEGRTEPQINLYLPFSEFVEGLQLIIRNDLTTQQKLLEIIKIKNQLTESVSDTAELQVPGAQAYDFNSLLNEPGDIVSPSREIVHLRAPDNSLGVILDDFNGIDYYYNQQIYDKVSGPLAPFLKNDYKVTYRQYKLNSYSIDDVYKYISSVDYPFIFTDGHGGKYLFMYEIHEIGPDLKTIPENERAVEVKRQAEKMFQLRNLSDYYRNKYGKNSVLVGVSINAFKEFKSHYYEAVPAHLKYLAKNPMKYAAFYVSHRFFTNNKQGNMSKKALVYSLECKGGSMNPLDTRVFISSDSNLLITPDNFTSDLNKINQYLLASINPGPYLAEEDDFRNFDIINKFPLLPSTSNSCNSNSCNTSCSDDTLCNIEYYGIDGQTVTVSPHVKAINEDKLVFNSPMEELAAEDIVSIDATSCIVPHDFENFKPSWLNHREIKLPWSKVVREWKDSDFDAEGQPLVKTAVIRVKADKAVSKFSRIQLTGNPEACSYDCKNKETYKNPADIKYNATGVKHDFTAIYPCQERVYYQACQSSEVIEIENSTLSAPPKIIIGGNCYQQILPNEINKAEAILMNESVLYGQNETATASCNNSCIAEVNCLDKIFHYKTEPSGASYVYLNESRYTFQGQPYYYGGASAFASFYGKYIAMRRGCWIPSSTSTSPYHDGCFPFWDEEQQKEVNEGFSTKEYGIAIIPEIEKLTPHDVKMVGDNYLIESYQCDEEENNRQCYVTPNGIITPPTSHVTGEPYKFTTCELSTTTSYCDDGEFLYVDGVRSPYFSSNEGFYKDLVLMLDSSNREDNLVVKGHSILRNLGPGKRPQIFGNHSAIIKQCRIEERTERGTAGTQGDCLSYDGQIIGVNVTNYKLFGDQVLFVGKYNPALSIYDSLGDQASDRWIFLNGVYHDLFSIQGVDNRQYDYRLSQYELAFSSTSSVLVYDYYKKYSDQREGTIILHNFKIVDQFTAQQYDIYDDVQIFEDKYAYLKADLNGKKVLNYNGKLLGETHFGGDPQIFKDDIFYVGKNGEHIVNGKKYYSSTAPETIQSCNIHYKENVPTRPYGNLLFSYPKIKNLTIIEE
jgi:hypothetical protein